MNSLPTACLFAACLVIPCACSDDVDRDPDSGSAAAEPLRDPMKGTVLYAWRKAGESCFVAMPGTNRQKTFEEIDAAESVIQEDGWFIIRANGVAEAKRLISRVSSDYLGISGIHDAPDVDASTVLQSIEKADPAEIEALEQHWQSLQG